MRLSRRVPALFFLIGVLAIALHQWNASRNGETWPVPLLLMSAIAGWSLGGLIHPAIFFAAGKYGKDLPVTMKILAALFAAGGFVGGFFLLNAVRR